MIRATWEGPDLRAGTDMEEMLVNATLPLVDRTDREYLEMEAMLMAFIEDVRSEATAIDPLTRLRQRMPGLVRAAGLPGARVSYAGETALAQETVDSLAHDLG